MADYYSHNDPRRKGNDRYIDDYAGTSNNWIWAALIFVAFVGLIVLGSTGSSTVTTDGAAPAVTDQTGTAPAE